MVRFSLDAQGAQIKLITVYTVILSSLEKEVIQAAGFKIHRAVNTSIDTTDPELKSECICRWSSGN
jgi:hypothetical protein